MQALTLQSNLSESLSGQNLVKRNVKNPSQSAFEVSFKDMVEQASSFSKEKPQVSTQEKNKAPVSESETKAVKKEGEEKKTNLSEKTSPEKKSEISSSENLVSYELLPEENVEVNLSFMQQLPLENEMPVAENPVLETVNLLSEEMPVDQSLIGNIVLGEEELSYLQKNASDIDFKSLVEESPVKLETEDNALLSQAQVLASEEPETFLDEAVGKEIKNSEEKPSVKKNISFSENENALSETEDLFVKEESFAEKTKLSEEAPFERSVFTVTDERTFKNEIPSEETEASRDSGLKTEIVRTSENSVQMTMTLSENAEQNILSLNDQSAAAAGSTFQEMLSEQIQQNAPDFVKAGNIVLRDDNQGTINMILKPESLGNVKVSLQLSDKVITGEITVHSKEAMEAFKQNIDSLREAFVQSGYEDVQLNLNLAQNDSAAFAQQSNQSQGEQIFLANKAYGNYAESDVEVSSVSLQDYAALGENGINMIA